MYKKDWKKDKLDRFCDHCKKQGHTKETCFKIHGFPEWFGKKYGVGTGNSKLAANVTIGSEYFQEDPLEYTAAGPSHVDSSHSNAGTNIDPVMMHNIMQEVMKVMKGKQHAGESSSKSGGLSFAHCAGTSSTVTINSTWIVDSGATDHMSFDQSIFSFIRKLNKPVEVGLPDGSISLVFETGNVIISAKIVLKDVLLVPNFKHNLLSIGKLSSDANIEVMFNDCECRFIFKGTS